MLLKRLQWAVLSLEWQKSANGSSSVLHADSTSIKRLLPSAWVHSLWEQESLLSRLATEEMRSFKRNCWEPSHA